jgi:hypothetical protein
MLIWRNKNGGCPHLFPIYSLGKDALDLLGMGSTGSPILAPTRPVRLIMPIVKETFKGMTEDQEENP